MDIFPETSSLVGYVSCFSKVRALVIGDLILDQFTYGKVERISPEAPVPIFKVRQETQMLGGAGNVVANLCALGCQTSVIGIVGNDQNGNKIRTLLHECGARCYLLTSKKYPTIVKTRLIAESSHLSRIDREEVMPIITEMHARYERLLEKAVHEVDIVLVSDYNKGLLTSVTTPSIISLCHKLNKPVIVDPKGSDYSKYAGATLIKPNLKEFFVVVGGERHTPVEPEFTDFLIAGAQRLIDSYSFENVLVTLGEHGMALLSAEAPARLLKIPTQAREVFDVSGAGDTSLAALGAALGCHVSIREAMRIANHASGIAVGKKGTAVISQSELREALSSDLEKGNDIAEPERKIVSLEQARVIIRQYKNEGKVIGFTSGVYDCCHLGHISSLIETRQLCDVLVVAISSDASVKRNKGEHRPIQDERTRALLLASMEFVDYVILFEDNTPINIIKSLHPDVLAKEGQPLEDWSEAQYAKRYGAKIVMLSRVEGYSTTQLVDKMKSSMMPTD